MAHHFPRRDLQHTNLTTSTRNFSLRSDCQDGLNAILEAARVKNGVPGMSVAVMYKGEVIFAEGFGKRNEHQPFTKETISSIGSLTKAITSTAIGELVAEGKMNWNETPVNKYLPEFELKDPVLTSQLTIADLLSHRTIVASGGAVMVEDSFSKTQAGEFRKGEYDENYMAFAPAGDLHSNVLDLLKWGKVVVDGWKVEGGKQVLSKESVEMTVTPQNIVRQRKTRELSHSFTYGLGWGLVTSKGRNCDTHSGVYPGSSANLTPFPDDGLIIAQLANINPAELTLYVEFFIADKILNLPTYSTSEDWLFDKAVKATAEIYKASEEEREGKGLSARVEGTVSVLPREDMVGRFENPLYGVITIARVTPDKDEGKDEEEGLEFSYNEYRCKMEHYHFETFRIVLEDLGVFEAKLVSFEAGSDGHVARLSINFEEPDLVRFVKVKTSIATTVADKEE